MSEADRDMPTKASRYADAWGIRKLTSHALRNLRQDRQPRALWQQKARNNFGI